MINFSFDYGNSHWVVLDANDYMNWSDPTLRQWLRNDLQRAKGADWRFVSFHEPAYCSDRMFSAAHSMRVLDDIFDRGKVDIVFNGHAHNYERTFPLRPAAGVASGKSKAELGQIEMDRSFDGILNTHPRGTIHIISGGGGAPLFGLSQQDKPSSWLPVTARYIANVHSLTVCQIVGRRLTLKQISEEGRLLDKLTITKASH
jgi:hypothetical protein